MSSSIQERKKHKSSFPSLKQIRERSLVGKRARKLEAKRDREDLGCKVSHEIGNSSSTDDHTVKYCTACCRHYVLPKLPLVANLGDPNSPIYTTIPGTRLGFEQAWLVAKLIAKSDDTTLVVTNITSEIRGRNQLLALFRPFGEVRKAIHEHSISGNFGFVTFVDKEDAEKAMDKLNDGNPRGWDERVLKVDWASTLKKSI